jgi:hypothetical protein
VTTVHVLEGRDWRCLGYGGEYIVWVSRGVIANDYYVTMFYYYCLAQLPLILLSPVLWSALWPACLYKRQAIMTGGAPGTCSRRHEKVSLAVLCPVAFIIKV